MCIILLHPFGLIIRQDVANFDQGEESTLEGHELCDWYFSDWGGRYCHEITDDWLANMIYARLHEMHYLLLHVYILPD